MAVSIYCRMKKIIYCYTVHLPIQKKNLKYDIKQRLAKLFGRPYAITERQCSFLDYPVEGYAMEGMTWHPGKDVREAGCREQKTLVKLKKRIRKREMQESTDGDAFLFCAWEEGGYPTELLEKYYAWQRKELEAVYGAEQLIVLDGEEIVQEVTFVSQICGEYNYVTVVTERAEVWEALSENCYEEFGLSIRCVSDDVRLRFREKRTLILDWGERGRKCLRNLPEDSVYMDFYRAEGKRHVISVKCRKIPYLSPHNALDTLLKDTV